MHDRLNQLGQQLQRISDDPGLPVRTEASFDVIDGQQRWRAVMTLPLQQGCLELDASMIWHGAPDLPAQQPPLMGKRQIAWLALRLAWRLWRQGRTRNTGFWLRVRASPVTIILALGTLITSLAVAWLSQGSPLATVPVKALRHLGGLDFEQLRQGRIWLLITSQLVHVKQAHMLLNVATLLYAGFTLERILGHLQVFTLWLLAGGVGMLLSVYYGTPPFEVGSGASQATAALLGASIVVIARTRSYARHFPALTACIGLSIFGLDLLHGGLPKPGHMASLAAGLVLSWAFLKHGFATELRSGLAK